MNILIKHQTKDGEIHFSTVESWKLTEDEAMIEAIRDFKKTHTDVRILEVRDVTLGAGRNWNKDECRVH